MAFKDLTNALFPKDNNNEAIDTEDEAYDKDVDASSSKSGAKMVLVEPRAFSESQQIADHLKRRNSVVVNLKRVTNDQARRIVDFLSGTLYAIGGESQRLGYGIYLCTPKNVNVEGRISDEESEKKAKSRIEDEMDF